MRKPEAKPDRRLAEDGSHTTPRQEIAEGLRYMLGNRHLRRIAGRDSTADRDPPGRAVRTTSNPHREGTTIPKGNRCVSAIV
jgi:hypothetical protein